MVPLQEIMSTSVISLGPDELVTRAGELMREHRIRHIPIVSENNELLGIITQRDLLSVTDGEGHILTTGERMRKQVYTVTDNDDIRSAGLLMQRYKIGCLPIIQDNKLVGIVTDTDYVGLALNLLEQIELFDTVQDDED